MFLQAPLSQSIGVPKPFGGSSINSNYLSNNSYNNLESNTLPRAQSQSVTGKFTIIIEISIIRLRFISEITQTA